MKSAQLEWYLGDSDQALSLIEAGMSKYTAFEKFYLMKGQICEQINQLEQAKASYNAGLQKCPQCVPLWISLARFEERQGHHNRSRSILERSKLKLNDNDLLW